MRRVQVLCADGVQWSRRGLYCLPATAEPSHPTHPTRIFHAGLMMFIIVFKDTEEVVERRDDDFDISGTSALCLREINVRECAPILKQASICFPDRSFPYSS